MRFGKVIQLQEKRKYFISYIVYILYSRDIYIFWSRYYMRGTLRTSELFMENSYLSLNGYDTFGGKNNFKIVINYNSFS